MIRRRQAVFTDQRHELLRRNEERDCINETKEAQNDEPRQPVGISAMEKFSEDILSHHNIMGAGPIWSLLEANALEDFDETGVRTHRIPF